MAHFVRVWSDDDLKRGLVVTGQNLIDIDNKTLNAIDGVAGGSYAQSFPITIAGNGIRLHGPLQLIGNLAQVFGSPGRFITFGQGSSSDYFGYGSGHPGITPAVYTPFDNYILTDVYQIYNYFAGGQFTPPGGINQAIGAPGVSVQPNITGLRFFVPLNVYGGAPKIDSLTMTWAVGTSHGSQLPTYLPRMRVIAVKSDSTVIPLRTLDTTTDANGFQFLPTPVSAAAYYNGGSLQTWTYICNVAVPVDLSLYRFYIDIMDESGTGSFANNRFYGAVTNYSNITIFDSRH